MSGGKQTPRQKMIEMMYLVLTALLALNVSKEILAAFVTINEKLDTSSEVIRGSNLSIYGTFDRKRAALILLKGDTKNLDYWQGKANTVELRTKQLISFTLTEANDMITILEKKDWAIRDPNGFITRLKPLFDVENYDNYDQPTRMFVGTDPKHPNARGMAIRDSILAYRDQISELMGNYKIGEKEYTFISPKDPSNLTEALKTVNSKDTAEISAFYRSMTIPKTMLVKEAGEPETFAWSAALFNHTPLAASVAMFTSLKLDILNSENHAANFMLNKVDVQPFNFNKIEPLAFARTGYINAGDSLDLKVMIAAYDSTDVPPIKYGINDSIPANWKQTEGTIHLDGSTPGSYKVTGQIGVKVKGQTKWKGWSFNYTVGKPTGTISLPEMRVLYRGYDNMVEGAASGFPSYSISGGGNVSVSRKGTLYVAKPGNGREATLNIAGVAEDGTSTALGHFKFKVQNLPKPDVRFGRIENGETATSQEIRNTRRLFAGYPPSIPLNAVFNVSKWELQVSGAPRPQQGTGPNLSVGALRAIANAGPGAMIKVVATVIGPGGVTMRQAGVYSIK